MRPTVVVSAVQCAGGHAHDESCRYQIAWSINPHMVPGSVDFDHALAQHRALVRILRLSGAEVIELPFVHAAYDSVFTKDPALLVESHGRRLALLARPYYAERRKEQAARAGHYEALGFEVVATPGPTWEGGDVAVLPDGAGLLLGHGPRSHRASAAWLEQQAELPVIPIELRDPHLFHLDMALSVLPDGTVLVCEEALAPGALRALGGVAGVGDIVRVPREDALAFGLNMVFIGKTAICGAKVPRVQRLLQERGYRTVVTPLGEFHRSGGGAACLVTQLHPEPLHASLAISARARAAVGM